MQKILLEILLHLGIVLPFAILFLKEKSWVNYKRLMVFALVFIVHTLIVFLPSLFDFFKIIDGSWNWNGKILSILWGVSAFFIFRKYFSANNYFTLKQDKTGSRKAFLGALAIVILSGALFYFMGSSDFDLETLAFQLLMPGLDEEIVYRGILLGLLMSSLKSKFYFLGNPSVLLTSILFGLIHALKLNAQLEISFDPFYFLYTGIAGYVWGWITIKSRSILFAMLSHSLAAFFGSFISMIK